MNRECICTRCHTVFESGERGARPEFCNDCRPVIYKERAYHYSCKIKGNPAYEYKTISYQRKKLLEASGYKCSKCKKATEPAHLEIHHLDGKGAHKVKNPNNRDSNLVVVCDSCHHKYYHPSSQIKLSQIEQVVELRYKGKTFQSIGDRLGITRQRAHQIFKRENDNLQFTP